MEFIKVFNAAPAAALLSTDGVCATDKATAVINNLKAAAKAKNVFITYWCNGKVTFTCIYSHTTNVPAKALQSLEDFEKWNINRINHYFAADKAKCGIL